MVGTSPVCLPRRGFNLEAQSACRVATAPTELHACCWFGRSRAWSRSEPGNWPNSTTSLTVRQRPGTGEFLSRGSHPLPPTAPPPNSREVPAAAPLRPPLGTRRSARDRPVTCSSAARKHSACSRWPHTCPAGVAGGHTPRTFGMGRRSRTDSRGGVAGSDSRRLAFWHPGWARIEARCSTRRIGPAFHYSGNVVSALHSSFATVAPLVAARADPWPALKRAF